MNASYQTALLAAFDDRATFERTKKADNDTIQKTLADLRKSIAHEAIAEIMNTCDVPANFINRSMRVDSRMNVYAAEKIVNVARFLASVDKLNHYTRAIIKTAFSLEQQKLTMTREDAQAACSTLYRHRDKQRDAHIVRYDRAVALNTVATQYSSSLDALCMYNILVKSQNEANQDVFTLNRANTVTLDLLVSLDCISNDQMSLDI